MIETNVTDTVSSPTTWKMGADAGFLASITSDFATSLDIEETLQHAVDKIIDYLHAEAASIFLLDNTRQTLICRRCAGPVDVSGLELAADQGIVGATVNTNSLQLVRDAQKHSQFAGAVDADTGFVTRSILCAPLSIHGECIGALELINKRIGDGLFSHADTDLASAVAAAAALAIHNARMAQALIEQERMRKELELARAIQLSLLPTVNDSLPILGLNLPAREVSGDFYDFVELPDQRIYFCVADVAGKGMNAAILMAKTISLLRCLAKDIEDPAALLAKVNTELVETSSRGLFVTIVAGFIDRARGLIRYANAGHHSPLVRRRQGVFESRPASAPPLGILPELNALTETLSLADGPMYFFTDGVTEAVNVNHNPLGVTGFKRILDQVSELAAPQRLQAIVEIMLAEQYDFDDDLTLLLIDTHAS